MNLFCVFFTVYSWGVIAFLVFFLFSIARFFEQKSGRRSFYYVFLVPSFLFLSGAAYHAFMRDCRQGDIVSDLSRFLGGVILLVAGYYLLSLMTGEKHL